jgi:hypothetical protein
LLGILGILVGGWPIFEEAAENLMARRMTMELRKWSVSIHASTSNRILQELYGGFESTTGTTEGTCNEDICSHLIRN